MIKQLLFVFCFLVAYQSQAQRILVLDKNGGIKRTRYYEGNVISFTLKSGEFFYGPIALLTDSALVINDTTIQLNQIKSVNRTKGGSAWRVLASVGAHGVIGYPLLVTTNNLIAKQSPFYSERQIQTTSIFALAFIVGYKFSSRKYKINNRWTLKVIDITI